jgi:NAD(P)-dependent dehydrogenase (short-subunit alcohol dehydrogenase family)
VSWTPPRLDGTVAVVTGATRGVGKGIALVLGECGATVHLTGRSTVDEAAAEVTARGGRGIGHRVDHTDDAQVQAFLSELDRIDLLVVNAWGGYEDYDHELYSGPFWKLPIDVFWRKMFDAGLRAQYATTHMAMPLLMEQRSGLVVFTGGWDEADEYLGSIIYDVSKAGTSRLVRTFAHELRPYDVAVVGVYPGFTRTEGVVAAFESAGMEPPEETQSPEFAGRAVAHIAADPDVPALSGTGAQTATYAQRYAFTDVDGRTFEPFRMPAENRL